MATENPDRVETVVRMTDGREVIFAGTRKVIKSTDALARTVTFDFINGETRTFAIPDESLALFAVHGAAQKLGDTFAGVKDPDDMVVAFDEMAEHLAQPGAWDRTRTSDNAGFNGASIVIRALSLETGKTVAEVKSWLEQKAATMGTSRAALYKTFRNPATKVGQRIASLEAEKAAKSTGIDADAALAELAA